MEGRNKSMWSSIVGSSASCILLDGKANVLSYVNTITGGRQDSPPPEFKGGLLADQMGLGKSLSMISLVASNPATSLKAAVPAHFNLVEVPDAVSPVKTTLLVVPLPREYFLSSVYLRAC